MTPEVLSVSTQTSGDTTTVTAKVRGAKKVRVVAIAEDGTRDTTTQTLTTSTDPAPTPEPTPEPTPAPAPTVGPLLSAAEIDSLPTSGTGWSAALAIASKDPGPVDFSDHDSYTQTNLLIAALVWRRTGQGIGPAAIKTKLSQVMNKPNASGAVSPLTAHRQIGGYVATAHLMAGILDAAFEAAFKDWARTQLTATQSGSGGSAKATTVVGCAKFMPNNWGAYGRWSMATIGALLEDEAVLADVDSYHRRFCGDLSAPNFFGPTSEDNTGWLLPASLPRSGAYDKQGVINPPNVGAISSANSADAVRGSAKPPLVGKGVMYTVGALDGALGTAAVLAHAGFPDAMHYGNDALGRNARSVTNTQWAAESTRDRNAATVANHVYNTGITLPGPATAVDRAIGVASWLCASGSTWLR